MELLEWCINKTKVKWALDCDGKMDRELFCNTLKILANYSLTKSELQILTFFAYGDNTVEEIRKDLENNTRRIRVILKNLVDKGLIIKTGELRNRFPVYDFNPSLFNIF